MGNKFVCTKDGRTWLKYLPFLHSYLVLYPFMWDRPILDSHTLQVYKPLFFFQSTYLTGEPQWELFLYYTLFINVFSTFLFSKGSKWKREAWYCFQPLFYLHYCGDLFKFLYLHAYITFIVTTYIDIIYVRLIYRKAKTVGWYNFTITCISVTIVNWIWCTCPVIATNS